MALRRTITFAAIASGLHCPQRLSRLGAFPIYDTQEQFSRKCRSQRRQDTKSVHGNGALGSCTKDPRAPRKHPSPNGAPAAYVTLLLMPHAAGREGEVTTTGLPFFAALILGIMAAALFGLLLGLPAIRLRGDYLAIVTIAAAEIFRLLVRDLESITGGVYGIINYTENFQKYRPLFIDKLTFLFFCNCIKSLSEETINTF